MNNKQGKIIQIHLNKWEDIFRLDPIFRMDFIYRGQCNAEWDLRTSIERTFYPKYNYSSVEFSMIELFFKKHHLYSSREIDFNHKSELLAMMQHHGAVTRLLDFTNSIYIAAYFAIVDNPILINGIDAAIWAINRRALAKKLSEEIVESFNSYADRIISKATIRDKKTVIPIEPLLHTERLSKQQGVFLMPTDSAFSFRENLCSAFEVDSFEFKDITLDELLEKFINHEKINVFKLIIPQKQFFGIADYLREVNINAEVLFPGLDGLAKSTIHNARFLNIERR